MIFYILTKYKIEAHEHQLRDFIADDLMSAIQAADTKIAVDKECLSLLMAAYPNHHVYKVEVGK